MTEEEREELYELILRARATARALIRAGHHFGDDGPNDHYNEAWSDDQDAYAALVDWIGEH